MWEAVSDGRPTCFQSTGRRPEAASHTQKPTPKRPPRGGGEGVKSNVYFPLAPGRGEGPGVRGSTETFCRTNSSTPSRYSWGRGKRGSKGSAESAFDSAALNLQTCIKTTSKAAAPKTGTALQPLIELMLGRNLFFPVQDWSVSG